MAVIPPARDVLHIYHVKDGSTVRVATFDPSGSSARPSAAGHAKSGCEGVRSLLLLSAWAADERSIAVAAQDGKLYIIDRCA